MNSAKGCLPAIGAAVVAMVVGLLFLVSLLGGAEASCGDPGGGQQPGSSKQAQGDVPSNYLTLYRQAGAKYGLPWNVLAAVGSMESDHGRSNLPGVKSGENYAGAAGPMQFIGPTWATYGVDGNGDGKKVRYDPADAIPSAANYLSTLVKQRGSIHAALRQYNGNPTIPATQRYADEVLARAKRYAAGNISVGDDNTAGTQCPPAPPGSGRPDGVKGTKSTITGNQGLTPTMRRVLLELDTKFGPFPAIGCFRSTGDPQDHGKGMACDFMETTGGRAASPAARAHGDAVAQYAIANGKQLGVKYVIWRQRIWNITLGDRAWRSMEDRGGITANHYDHVHLSVQR
jgi:hypothetical protein